ncbi:methylmalonyl-CoA mutase family protein [Aureimonas pseudogalii]|uniref:Methylmalonyl-CoA mutase n=1 Tax=Aureimonas pseudogalii TaxID=1744844 RepID=A0A7W6H3H2_9HYPH|nr:methylmalonyl-CoA mutase family protein [Aureimonas pseudogalii]MBB3998056.1 methylmalonyl-CoA mutase [Aureimonas pseudogalii]
MQDEPDLDRRWRASVERVLKGASFDEVLVSRTADDLRIEPLYPTVSPGPRAFRQRTDRPWRIVQRVDHPEAGPANELALADLEGGADGLNVVFAGAPGSFGFGLRDADALAGAMAGVELDLVSLALDPAPGGARETVEALRSLAAERRLTPDRLDIRFGLDPLSSEDGIAMLARRLYEDGFANGLLRADGARHHEAGATEAEEIAAAVSSALCGLRMLEAAGMPLEAANAALDFRLAVDQDQFLGIAKLRALRQVWAGVETACGLVPRPLRLDARSSRRMMTTRDGETNLLRLTLAGFSAGMGGADALSLLPHSAAAGLPDAFARRLARNLQHILVDECRLAVVGDPAAGSGAFEALTQSLAERATAILNEIEQGGGLGRANAREAWSQRLAVSRARRAAEFAAGSRVLLGVTLFPPAVERPAGILDVVRSDPADADPWPPCRDENLAQPTPNGGGENSS